MLESELLWGKFTNLWTLALMQKKSFMFSLTITDFHSIMSALLRLAPCYAAANSQDDPLSKWSCIFSCSCHDYTTNVGYFRKGQCNISQLVLKSKLFKITELLSCFSTFLKTPFEFFEVSPWHSLLMPFQLKSSPAHLWLMSHSQVLALSYTQVTWFMI